jgi:hypothetical protein
MMLPTSFFSFLLFFVGGFGSATGRCDSHFLRIEFFVQNQYVVQNPSQGVCVTWVLSIGLGLYPQGREDASRREGRQHFNNPKW